MKTTFKYNVERYCTYSNELVTRLREAGHKETHIYEKIYEGTLVVPSKDFIADMKVWRQQQRHSSSGYTFNIDDLFSQARERYTHYKDHMEDWPTQHESRSSRSSRNRRRRRDRSPDERSERSDMAALHADIKATKKQIALLADSRDTASRESRSSSSSNLSSYSYERHYGKNKDFKHKHEFMAWLYTPPRKGTTDVIHGITWHWCKHCQKMGSHKTDVCRKASSEPPTKKQRTTAYVSKHKTKNDYTSSDSSDSDSGSESDLSRRSG